MKEQVINQSIWKDYLDCEAIDKEFLKTRNGIECQLNVEGRDIGSWGVCQSNVANLKILEIETQNLILEIVPGGLRVGRLKSILQRVAENLEKRAVGKDAKESAERIKKIANNQWASRLQLILMDPLGTSCFVPPSIEFYEFWNSGLSSQKVDQYFESNCHLICNPIQRTWEVIFLLFYLFIYLFLSFSLLIISLNHK